MFSKIGPHVLSNTAPALAWASQAPVVKQFERADALRAAPANALKVCRPIWHLRTDSGVEAARDIIRLYDSWGYRPPITEFWNEGDEIGQHLGSGLERRVELTAEAVGVFHANNLQVAGFSFSVANGSEADWHYIRDHGFAGADYIALHEYWGNHGFTLDCALRHRRVHEWLGGVHPPIIITECGRDWIPEEGTFVGGWIAQGISAEQYLQELIAYDYALLQDSYVRGGTPFTAGAAGDPQWKYFDVDTLVPAILGAGPIEEPVRLSGWLVFGMLAFAAGSVAVLLNKLQPYEILELQAEETIPPGYVEVG